MPSFFSKKTRSQQASSAGSAGESPSGSAGAPPPPPPPDPYQQQQFYQHQQQQQHSQQDFADGRSDRLRRPSEPFIPANQFPPHPALNSYPDLRYGRDLPPDEQQQQQHPLPPPPSQQQQQQQQQYRHPTHHNPPLDRPTISLVTHQQVHTDPPSYQPSPSLDKHPSEQLWANANTSSQDLHLQDKSVKLQKKKGFFSRNQSVASSSPGKQQKKPENSLGRSHSVKHPFGQPPQQPPPQQAQQQQPQPEHVRVASLQTNPNISLDNLNSATPRPPTGEPASPRVYEPNLPQTPTESQSFHPAHHVWQHSRPDSVESIPSQVSFQRQNMSFYQGEMQPPSPLYFPSSSSSSFPSQHGAIALQHPAHDPSGPWRRRSPNPEHFSFPARPSSRQSLGLALPPASLPVAQYSDLVQSQDSSRRPSVQHSGLNIPPSVSDMAHSDRAQQQQQQQQQQSGSQAQIPGRKDSLAAPGQSQLPSPGPSFKGNSSQQNLHDMSNQGRETPPSGQQPSKFREELESLDIASLVLRHEELHSKYQKVKRYYFEKEAQVTHLQNTVAHQRMAVSRTVLDDNEYSARFNRLDGAIKELAFSIRKDWKTIPDWLHPYVNEDAVAVGTKEMTGVGRAVISRWVVEDVFNRYFHPGLERSFSERLKAIELKLRQQQGQVFNDDDKENQVARISNWRRTTLDGLTDELQSKATAEHQAQLTEYLVEKLSATLQFTLKEPPPPELAHYTQMIVQNAINIAEKIPQESRDIIVEYIVPGTHISETNMKVETGLPPLTRPIAEGKDFAGNRTSIERNREDNDDMDVDNKDSAAASSNSPVQAENNNSINSKGSVHIPQNREQRKKYPFGSLMGKKSHVPSSSSASNTAAAQSPSQAGGGVGGGAAGGADQARSVSASDNNSTKDREEQQTEKRARVRFATFLAVEVRGRGPNNVLIQAPVYTIE